MITQAQRRHGFLPGPGFDPRRHSELSPAARQWRDAALAIREDEADQLGPMFLTMALRRLSDRADLPGISSVLELAVDRGLAEGQAVWQATKLLRRGTALARCAAQLVS